MKSSSDVKPRFLLSLPCIKYQKSKATFKSSLNSDVSWDTLYYLNTQDKPQVYHKNVRFKKLEVVIEVSPCR